MERINKIINHPLWISAMNEISRCEEKRRFCNHNLDHLLQVSRIAYIFSLENNLCINKELIYASALLHDIGRGEEYINGTPHEIAGAEIATKILKETDFTDTEILQITNAISCHRGRGESKDNITSLGQLLKYADKVSRNCFLCNARKDCKWSEAEKNKGLEI